MNTLKTQPLKGGGVNLTVDTIVTHDGVFHADEVAAIAILLLLMGKTHRNVSLWGATDKGFYASVHSGNKTSKIAVIRDRKFVVEGNSQAMVLDVGQVYDHSKRLYDHHQPSFKETWEDGTPMSACGLIYRHYCDGSNFDKRTLGKICNGIDKRDNGILGDGEFSITNAISSFTPAWEFGKETTPTDMNLAFMSALRWTMELFVITMYGKNVEGIIAHLGVVLNNDKKRAVGEWIAESMISKLIEELEPNAPILHLNQWIPFSKSKAIKNSPKTLKFVVFAGLNSGEFCCSTISDWDKTEKGSTLKSRCPFPEKWAGLSGEELERVSGIKGAKFCHKNLFLFVATSKAAAVEAAVAAIEKQDAATLNQQKEEQMKH